MSHPTHFVITGNPPVKKNSRDIVRNSKTGRMYPVKSRALQSLEDDAIIELQSQKGRLMKLPYTIPLRIKFLFYRGDKYKVDLSNLYEFAQDVLQSAGIITDDVLIESHDGSRRMYDHNNPRTEIYIYPFEE